MGKLTSLPLLSLNSGVIWWIIRKSKGAECAVPVGPPLGILLSLGRGESGAKARRGVLDNMDDVLPTKSHCGTLRDWFFFSLPWFLHIICSVFHHYQGLMRIFMFVSLGEIPSSPWVDVFYQENFVFQQAVLYVLCTRTSNRKRNIPNLKMLLLYQKIKILRKKISMVWLAGEQIQVFEAFLLKCWKVFFQNISFRALLSSSSSFFN